MNEDTICERLPLFNEKKSWTKKQLLRLHRPPIGSSLTDVILN